jgi:hypothetical protein
MTDEMEFITVFRSGDPTAQQDAENASERLAKGGIRAIVLGDETPGVVEGSWEVRVPAADRARAEALVDLPGPREEDESEVTTEGQSHDLDFVTLASFDGIGSEMQSTLLRSALEGNGIPCAVIGISQIPSLGFEVRVPKTRLEEALTIVAGADQSGGEVAEGESE